MAHNKCIIIIIIIKLSRYVILYPRCDRHHVEGTVRKLHAKFGEFNCSWSGGTAIGIRTSRPYTPLFRLSSDIIVLQHPANIVERSTRSIMAQTQSAVDCKLRKKIKKVMQLHLFKRH